MMKGALLREIGSLLPFTINVMLSSPGRPGILSEDAVAYIRQRSKIWATLSLVPASPVMADASQDSSTSVAGSYGTADPLAKLACATLMLQLQQSAMLDLVHLVTLLCFIAIYSMTGSLLLHTPRRALLYLCFWASPFRQAIVSAILSAGMGGTTDGFAAVSYLFYATGRPKLAMLCCLTSSAGCRCVCDWCSLLLDFYESGQRIDREWRGEGAFDDCAFEVRLCVPKALNGNLLVDGDPKAYELTSAVDRVEQVAAVQ